MDYGTSNIFSETPIQQNNFKFGENYSPCIFDDENTEVNKSEIDTMDYEHHDAHKIYAKIPKSIITDKDYSSYRVLNFAMVYLQSPLISIFCASYHAFGLICNFKADYRYVKKNFVDLLECYQRHGYINILSLEHQNLAVIKRTDKLEFKPDNSERYGVIYENELYAICQFNGYNKRVNQSHVLLVLAFIRCSYFYIDGFFERGCYMHIHKISEEVGFKDKLVSTCIDYLVQMDILQVRKTYDVQINDKWRTGYTVFADAQDTRGDGHYGEEQINKIIKYLNKCKEKYSNLERGD